MEKFYDLFNLATEEEITIQAPTAEAALCRAFAFAERAGIGDDLEAAVEAAKEKVVEGEKTLSLGDWCVFKDGVLAA